MYQIGDLVVYGNHGVCRIELVEERMVDRKAVSYFVLVPLDNGQTQFYIPVHNQVALSKIRPLLTLEQVLQILRSPDVTQDCWIPEENRRKLRYKELITSGDFGAIAQMVHTLRQQKIRQIEAGRKFHLCDDNFLRDGQRVLISELAIILDAPASDVAQTIEKLLIE